MVSGIPGLFSSPVCSEMAYLRLLSSSNLRLLSSSNSYGKLKAANATAASVAEPSGSRESDVVAGCLHTGRSSSSLKVDGDAAVRAFSGKNDMDLVSGWSWQAPACSTQLAQSYSSLRVASRNTLSTDKP